MEMKVSSITGDKEIEVDFTDKPVTAWGGLVLFGGLAHQLKLTEVLRESMPIRMRSPNATDPVEIVLAFLAGVLTGARRFAHVERLRWDVGVRTLLGVKRFVSDATLTRFFRRFGQRQVTEMFATLSGWQLSQVDIGHDEVLDLDSSVFERYGRQEGALLGYNAKKTRRPSHHPLLAVLANRPFVVHAWLRSGNTHSSRGASAFLMETVALLPSKVRYLRADAGFSMEPFLTDAEQLGFTYAISARLTQRMKAQVAGLEWRALDEETAVSDMSFQAMGWIKPRRIVVIRQRVQERDFVRGQELFDDPAFVYQAIVTNRIDSAEEVWRFYRPHADIENRIRELKWDYGINGFCLKRFYPTEVAFRLVCFLHNLMTLLQQKIGLSTHQTLGTMRSHLLACGALVGRKGRRIVLRLSLQGPWKACFQAHLAVLWPSVINSCVAVESG